MRTLLENLREDEEFLRRLVGSNGQPLSFAGRFVCNDIGQAIARIEELEKQKVVHWRSIKKAPPPEGKMFVWRRPRGGGRYSLGLAYWTVSNTWADLPPQATHWLHIPES